MFATRINYAWMGICLASIFICLNTEASSLAKSLPLSPQPDATFFNSEDIKDIEPLQKNIVVRSADSDDNYVDDDNEKKDKSKSEDEIAPPPHPHGSHGPLGHVKVLLEHVQNRGGIHALGNIGGNTHRIMPNHNHESAIETEADRNNSNAGTGLQVLEFFGTLFTTIWGFLSNIPAFFASSSAGLSGGGNRQ